MMIHVQEGDLTSLVSQHHENGVEKFDLFCYMVPVEGLRKKWNFNALVDTLCLVKTVQEAQQSVQADGSTQEVVHNKHLKTRGK